MRIIAGLAALLALLAAGGVGWILCSALAVTGDAERRQGEGQAEGAGDPVAGAAQPLDRHLAHFRKPFVAAPASSAGPLAGIGSQAERIKERPT
ncbi:hypothetical protein [Amaricoccus sp.]|uniref:hypothetical protein n=1 Tax=Amaricoccus sp. TaxID=1872485 RepID=UPI0026153191|nr:hypothetical protein [Amaricoccus sp.]HRO10037.1 hypothetical protein [Amaricoccus sp.]